jgi:hypothetical protein
MENIKRCNMMDKRLEDIIDSSDPKDRFEAEASLLTSEINAQLLFYKKNYPDCDDRVLVLGKQEMSILTSSAKKSFEADRQLRLEIESDGSYTSEMRREIVAFALPNHEDVDEEGVLTKQWNMPIYLSNDESFVGVFVKSHKSIFDEDFEMNTKVVAAGED